jgi:hypothetical protein
MVALNRVIVTMMIQLNTYHCNVVACSIWRVIQIPLNLYPLHNVVNIFGSNWLHGINHKFRIFSRVRALAVIRFHLLFRDYMISNGNNYSRLLVIYRCTHLLRLWSWILWMVTRHLFMEVCRWLVFIPHGRHRSLRICPPCLIRSTSSLSYLYFAYFYFTFLVCCMCVHSVYAEVKCCLLCSESVWY